MEQGIRLVMPGVDKQWIYKGKLRTVKTPGGHHRIPEEDIEKHPRATLGHGSREKWRVDSDRISESNQLAGRILELKVDGLVAQVTVSVGDYRLTSIISTDAASRASPENRRQRRCAAEVFPGDDPAKADLGIPLFHPP
jgi:predicted site-specific integrase-resolvase